MVKLIVINCRYYEQIKTHVLHGYTTAIEYNAAYNEVLTEISKFTSSKNVESISLTKLPGSNVTNLTFAGYSAIVKVKGAKL